MSRSACAITAAKSFFAGVADTRGVRTRRDPFCASAGEYSRDVFRGRRCETRHSRGRPSNPIGRADHEPFAAADRTVLERPMREHPTPGYHARRHGPFVRICVAVRDGAEAENAARLALSLVRGDPRAEVAFCHVINVPRLLASFDRGANDYGITLDGARAAAKNVLADCSLLARQAGVSARTYVCYGQPASAVISYAAGIGADLIVIGNRPRQKMRRLLSGSVRDEITRESTLPVLVARSAKVRSINFAPRRIVVLGADLPASLRAKRFAAELANDFAAHLVLLPVAHAGTLERDQLAGAYSPDLLVVAGAKPRRLHEFFAADLVERALQDGLAPVLVVPDHAPRTLMPELDDIRSISGDL